MSLIQCPDCGTQVSSSAVACPRCARPIASSRADDFDATSIIPTPWMVTPLALIISFGMLIFFLVVSILMYVGADAAPDSASFWDMVNTSFFLLVLSTSSGAGIIFRMWLVERRRAIAAKAMS